MASGSMLGSTSCGLCGRDLSSLGRLDARTHLESCSRRARIAEKYQKRYGKYLAQ